MNNIFASESCPVVWWIFQLSNSLKYLVVIMQFALQLRIDQNLKSVRILASTPFQLQSDRLASAAHSITSPAFSSSWEAQSRFFLQLTHLQCILLFIISFRRKSWNELIEKLLTIPNTCWSGHVEITDRQGTKSKSGCVMSHFYTLDSCTRDKHLILKVTSRA